MADVTIYDYWRSSASYRVRIALNLKGIEFKSVPVNLLDGSHQTKEHRQRNPQGFVPALAIDGMMMTQSLAIIEYLDWRMPQPPYSCRSSRCSSTSCHRLCHRYGYASDLQSQCRGTSRSRL